MFHSTQSASSTGKQGTLTHIAENYGLFCAQMHKSDLTLWLIDHHHAAQQKGEGQNEEGGIRVTVSSQELQEEY